MIDGLLKYLHTRLTKFPKMQGNINIDEFFVEPLLIIFEERIFKQTKSNFVQYIALFIFGSINSNKIGSIARSACKLFIEKVLSYLIRKSFPNTTA